MSSQHWEKMGYSENRNKTWNRIDHKNYPNAPSLIPTASAGKTNIIVQAQIQWCIQAIGAYLIIRPRKISCRIEKLTRKTKINNPTSKINQYHIMIAWERKDTEVNHWACGRSCRTLKKLRSRTSRKVSHTSPISLCTRIKQQSSTILLWASVDRSQCQIPKQKGDRNQHLNVDLSWVRQA